MQLKSLEGCRLKIGSYPPFEYNACGGGGKGTLLPTKKNNILYLSFSPKAFSIPPLNSRTTKFVSLPLPLRLSKSKCQWISQREFLIRIPEKYHCNSNPSLFNTLEVC